MFWWSVISTSDEVLAYAAHWDGSECPDCGVECEWDPEQEILSCSCEDRSALGVWLGNTPT